MNVKEQETEASIKAASMILRMYGVIASKRKETRIKELGKGEGESEFE